MRDLSELVERAAREFSDAVAFVELGPHETIEQHTFRQLRDDVESLGTAFIDLGLAGKHVALVGESCYAYVVAYLAVVNARGVIVPIDKELTNNELVHLLRTCDAEALLYGDALRRDVAALTAACPLIGLTVDISPHAKPHTDPGLVDLLETGRRLVEAGDHRFADVVIDPDALSAILFTSGTTGANKGVMLCQRNITAVIHGAFSLHSLPHVSISVLPIHHSYEFNIHVLGAIFGGLTVCFNDSVMHVKENLVRFSPEMSCMVPMIVEALYANIWREAAKTNLDRQLRYGVAFSNAVRLFGIDKRALFFKPIRENLGGRLQLIVCGAAPLRPEIVKGMDDLGIEIYNGYGITECAPLISSNSRLLSVPGSVGIPIPGIEIRIDSPDGEGNGEIQVRGPNVMLGYYNDPEATARTFTDDRWFKTGDLGHIGRRGALFVTGRQKNLIILPNGKNVQPEELEEHLLAHLDYLKEVVVYQGSTEAGVERIVASGFLDADFVERVGASAAHDQFESDVTRLNKKMVAYKHIHHVEVRDVEFEKTNTKKIKRFTVTGA